MIKMLRFLIIGLFSFGLSPMILAKNNFLFYALNNSDQYIKLSYYVCDKMLGCGATQEAMIRPSKIKNNIEINYPFPGVRPFLLAISAIEVNASGIPVPNGALGSFGRCVINPKEIFKLDITNNQITCASEFN